MRKSGFYWVRLKDNGKWHIGEYNCESKLWNVYGFFSIQFDNFFKEIDERQITREPK